MLIDIVYFILYSFFFTLYSFVFRLYSFVFALSPHISFPPQMYKVN